MTSKSKYGIKYDEAGSIVEEKLHDSEIKNEKKQNEYNKYLLKKIQLTLQCFN